MASIKKNIIYSSILTVSGYLFPLITFPYVTRVLGVNNIGICNFVDSIVQYFIYFSMMGITTVGIREIARTKGNSERLSRTFNNLLTLNLTSTGIAIVVLLVCTLFVPQLQEYKYMFYIGAAKVLGNTLLVEWLYKGLEDFKYITARTIIIRGLYVLSVIMFVRSKDDYFLYFVLTSFSVVVNAIVNIIYCRKFVSFSVKHIHLKRYLSPFFTLGVYLLLTSMYTTFNVAYLGFVSGTTEVGFYSTATKLYTIIMSFFTAFTGVMLPRMSSLLSDRKVYEFKKMTGKSFDALFVFAIPLVIITEVCAPEIIKLIAGDGYEGAIIPMRIVMPLMLIIGYEQIIVLQMLTPMEKDNAILINSIVGAAVAILANVFLVNCLASIGTAIVWVLSEFSVLLSAQFFVHKYIGYKIPVASFMKRLFCYSPIFVICCVLNSAITNFFVSLLCISGITFTYCVAMEICVFKNELACIYSNKIIKRK